MGGSQSTEGAGGQGQGQGQGGSASASASASVSAEELAAATKVHAHPEGLYLDESPSRVWEKEDVAAVDGAFTIEGLFSATECERIIAASEALGYTVAPVTTRSGPVLMPEIRSNMRLLFEAEPEFLAELSRRIRDLLPLSVPAAAPRSGPAGAAQRSGKWVLESDDVAVLNERIRMYRYSAGEEFRPHFDGAFPRTRTQVSLLTLIVYVSGELDGGTTTFFPDGAISFSSGPVTEPVSVAPVPGRALLFPHGPAHASPFHEGSPHASPDAYKYVFRSDIMYNWVPDPESDDESDDESDTPQDVSGSTSAEPQIGFL